MNLPQLLAAIREADTDYPKRYDLILEAIAVARKHGIAAGFRIDQKEPAWPVAFLELPTGQVSWHLPGHDVEWDGHTTEEKFERIERFIQQWPEVRYDGEEEWHLTKFNYVKAQPWTIEPDDLT